MMGSIFTVSVPLIGTLTADNFVDFKVPWDCQLVALSADVDTNNCNVIVGSTSDTDAYVNTTDGAVTAGTITLLDTKGEFVGDQYPHLSAGDIVRVTFDHTGSNPVDFFAVLFFTVG
jgi:hypothetical protein